VVPAAAAPIRHLPAIPFAPAIAFVPTTPIPAAIPFLPDGTLVSARQAERPVRRRIVAERAASLPPAANNPVFARPRGIRLRPNDRVRIIWQKSGAWPERAASGRTEREEREERTDRTGATQP
jgi:hypothetical protein